MEIVRTDRSEIRQEYTFRLDENIEFRLSYLEFDYPSERDKPEGAVKATLVVELTLPGRCYEGEKIRYSNVIYHHFDGDVSSESFLGVSVNSTFRRFESLEAKTREEIFGNLSLEAKMLFKRGMEWQKGREKV